MLASARRTGRRWRKRWRQPGSSSSRRPRRWPATPECRAPSTTWTGRPPGALLPGGLRGGWAMSGTGAIRPGAPTPELVEGGFAYEIEGADDPPRGIEPGRHGAPAAAARARDRAGDLRPPHSPPSCWTPTPRTQASSATTPSSARSTARGSGRSPSAWAPPPGGSTPGDRGGRRPEWRSGSTSAARSASWCCRRRGWPRPVAERAEQHRSTLFARPHLPAAGPALHHRPLPDVVRRTRCCATRIGCKTSSGGSTPARAGPAA